MLRAEKISPRRRVGSCGLPVRLLHPAPGRGGSGATGDDGGANAAAVAGGRTGGGAPPPQPSSTGVESLREHLCYYKSHVFLGFGGSSKSVRGKILHSKTLKTIYEIDGQWDRIVKLKDVHSGEVTVLYDAKKAISGLKTPILQAPQNMWPTESATVWSEVSQAILNKEWGKASAAKQNVEEKQRKLQRERKSSGELWVPKHFTVTHTKDNEWDCSPLEQSVPPAPIIVPP
ncbi:Oxysterol-binding protein [Musa troglodytarum]|uniref:Oxysterol-binding protein n=1 Tax=Musa troglodytarum TaxID=320322 RepID=A0A9E7I095_9LILI|nr:Oxysterol-binding protein [Musa troglodytarum]